MRNFSLRCAGPTLHLRLCLRWDQGCVQLKMFIIVVKNIKKLFYSYQINTKCEKVTFEQYLQIVRKITFKVALNNNYKWSERLHFTPWQLMHRLINRRLMYIWWISDIHQIWCYTSIFFFPTSVLCVPLSAVFGQNLIFTIAWHRHNI